MIFDRDRRGHVRQDREDRDHPRDDVHRDRGRDQPVTSTSSRRSQNRYNDYDYDYERRRRNRHRHHRFCYPFYDTYHYGGYRHYSEGPYHWHYNPHYFYLGAFSFWSPYWYYPNAYLEVGGSGSQTARVGGIGGLDLDVSPEKAQVFVDGRPLGVADDFDGFPDMLWLEEGTYDVAIYHPGFETIFRQYTIYPGLVIDVEDDMTPGEALHPDHHVPPSTVRRDARVEQDHQRQQAAERAPAPGSQAASGRLVLDIWPADAAVYLDGNFLGTAAEVSQLSAGLVVSSGEHHLEVIRPGYDNRELTVDVADNERQELVIELQR